MRNQYTLFKRKRKKSPIWYFYYWDGDRRIAKSTGKKTKWEAKIFVHEYLNLVHSPKGELTLKEYVNPYFIWDECPHVRRLLDEKKSITRNHVKIQRSRLINHVFTDPIANIKLSEITRADILDFRSRLIEEKSDSTANKTIGVLKTIFKEALYREDIDKDSTAGIGNIKYKSLQVGIFTIEEMKQLFPSDCLGSWKDQKDFTCFFLTAATGMRRGEILALKWKSINFQKQLILIEEAWKGRGEIGLPKWNRKRMAPLPQIVLEKLKDLHQISVKNQSNDFVFCYDNGKYFGETWWIKRFRHAMDGLGIDYRKRNLKPHSFRHTLNTILRNAGHDPAKIRITLGWQQEKTQDNYTHWQIEHLKDQADIVDNIFRD